MTDTARTQVEVRGYRLTGVYGSLTPDERQAIIRMWIDTGAVLPAEAQRRVGEVVAVVHDSRGVLAGVNTAYVAAAPGSSGTYYYYRTFIRPQHRGVRGLPTAMLRLALEVLRGYSQVPAPLGVVIIAENPKLMRSAVVRRLRALGFHLLGREVRGCDIWCLRFDGSTPAAPPGITPPS